MNLQPQVLCFLDILGFKNQFRDKERLHIIENYYDQLMNHVIEPKGGALLLRFGDGTTGAGWLTIQTTFFSDTIFLWTDYNHATLPEFTKTVGEAICVGLEVGLPLRGTIVVGEMILDKSKNKYLGEPLGEATDTEKNQKWIGASFGQSFLHKPYNYFFFDTILPFKSHYKDANNKMTATGITVDWPKVWRNSRTTDCRKIVTDLNNSSGFEGYYDNTIKYIEYSENNEDWYKDMSNFKYG
jgi:hypothetical protein